ncbi:hypothetical protein [Spirillospora sp. NPDC029432]|uniref:hypothetical protein n=1 Tax=Spirillospora sp. NPDC029432 TaxID=3154599 RepID=UPI0034534821
MGERHRSDRNVGGRPDDRVAPGSCQPYGPPGRPGGRTWEAQVANSSALADHRQAIWRCEDLRLNAAPTEEIAEARAAARITRSAITGPMTTLSLLAPELTEPARAAAKATYLLRDAPDRATLDTLLQAARDANGRLVAAARTYLT